jgi:hypothetical protein
LKQQSPPKDGYDKNTKRKKSTELGMIKFLARGKHLKADQDLARMKKHTQKRTFFGMFFAQGMFFFCQQRWPKPGGFDKLCYSGCNCYEKPNE